MVQRLKRWESPRRQGRNDKGKGGSARRRQLKKQTQMLRKKLKESEKADKPKNNPQKKQWGRETSSLPFFFIGDTLQKRQARCLSYGLTG
ncbi:MULTISPECIES: hypothetical protein [unclassified Coleofasciculus]|uniref:hypothetical protein n=1 Tax=unclassified Coleofasciculus TaxID=2692782 RepID=UPI0018803DE0|nr:MULTISPECIES: hypothetical protein [unclassified Coleofasciculus]MBE9127247.1 hypothetical protein [Coleofasciculus sp. LEGE 07081]MBE9150601.1 hypothetical protein [Coleofasciculus sp. LEGE 07092]